MDKAKVIRLNKVEVIYRYKENEMHYIIRKRGLR